jgi:hypothetical protein
VTEMSSSETEACMRRGVECRLHEWARNLLKSCLPFTFRCVMVRETGYVSEKVVAVVAAVTALAIVSCEVKSAGDIKTGGQRVS